jgi:glycosyltransferase involved in cell wall biosynthesis
MAMITDKPQNLPEEIREILSRNPNLELRLIGNLTDQDLVQIYSSSDLVIVTSLYESSSLPILEAVACETSVLASSIPPHLEMASDLPVAIYECGNMASLQESLEFLMKQIKVVGQADMASSIQKYEWKNIAGIYMKTFESLI